MAGGVAISAVGSAASNVQTSANTTTTVAVSPTAVGNILLWAAGMTTVVSMTVSTVSGGGVTTWTKIANQPNSTTAEVELWWGVVTATGSANITCTVSNGSFMQSMASIAQEFTGGPVWSLDGTASGLTNTSSTTITYPTQTPADTGRAYFGASLTGGTPNTTGQTSGYTVIKTSATSGLTLFYNPAVAVSAQSPTATSTGASTSASVGSLMMALDPRFPIRQTPLVPRLHSYNR